MVVQNRKCTIDKEPAQKCTEFYIANLEQQTEIRIKFRREIYLHELFVVSNKHTAITTQLQRYFL